jgi:serine/threonine-protein kinase
MQLTQAAMDIARARVGTVLDGKWRLDALLGIGGTACVYAATHRNGRRVAVKILHLVLCTDASLVTRFLREGYVANRIEHSGAVAVLDDDRADDGTVFLVMELLDGHSLERYTTRGVERMPYDRILRVVDETLDVLAAAHAKGIIHRDIKPANLFVTREGHVKVLDFGIARLAEPPGDGAHTQAGAVIGTPAFMPPEQARGRWELVDARTDLWAVGATMFALLVGDRPRCAETVQEELLSAITTPLPSLGAVMPGLPAALVTFVDRAVAFDRDDRWPDAQTMRRALLATGAPPAFEHTTRWSDPTKDTGTVVLETRPVEIQEAALTTGRPLSAGCDAAPNAASKARWWRTFAVAAGVSAGLAIVIVLSRGAHRLSWRGAGAKPSATASASATANPTTTAAATAFATSTPVAAGTSTSSAPSVPIDPLPSARPALKPRPAAAPPRSGDPLDQRF